MASDDEEYLPSDLDEEAFLNQAYGTDEEAYLLGATTGGQHPQADALCRRPLPPAAACQCRLFSLPAAAQSPRRAACAR